MVLLGRSLQDDIVEPVRSILIPHFQDLKELAVETGALGFGISGSGPSVYAFCKGEESAAEVKNKLEQFYSDKEIDFEIHLSAINKEGVKIL